MTKLLLDQTNNTDESVRGIVAECLGRLFISYPMDLMDDIEHALDDPNPLTKSTVAKSAKYSGINITDETMYTNLAFNLINLKKDADPEVKRNALEGLIAIVHTRWGIVS